MPTTEPSSTWTSIASTHRSSRKRLGIPAEVPCAVQQWEGLIAINYAARAQGITRHMRVHEAKARCPELVCVHVQTIGEAPGIQNQALVNPSWHATHVTQKLLFPMTPGKLRLEMHHQAHPRQRSSSLEWHCPLWVSPGLVPYVHGTCPA